MLTTIDILTRGKIACDHFSLVITG